MHKRGEILFKSIYFSYRTHKYSFSEKTGVANPLSWAPNEYTLRNAILCLPKPCTKFKVMPKCHKLSSFYLIHCIVFFFFCSWISEYDIQRREHRLKMWAKRPHGLSSAWWPPCFLAWYKHPVNVVKLKWTSLHLKIWNKLLHIKFKGVPLDYRNTFDHLKNE